MPVDPVLSRPPICLCGHLTTTHGRPRDPDGVRPCRGCNCPDFRPASVDQMPRSYGVAYESDALPEAWAGEYERWCRTHPERTDAHVEGIRFS